MKHPAPLFALSLVAALIVAACASTDPASTPIPTATPVGRYAELQVTLDRHRDLWQTQGSGDYTMAFRALCFCSPEVVAPVTLTVRGGVIVEARRLDTGQAIDLSGGFMPYLTVEELFTLLQDAMDRDAHHIEAAFDQEAGFPTSGQIDYDQRLSDEERGFTAGDLTLG